MFVGRVVGENRPVLAELLQVFLTTSAGAAGVHQAADAGDVARFELLDLRSDLGHPADDFVSGHAGVGGSLPLVAHRVNVRMADAAKEDLDLNVMLTGHPAFEAEGCEWGRGRTGGVGIGGVLEPIQAGPVIIEDNCFIGARSEVVEGVIIEENAVLSMGVYIGQSTKIYDRETGEVHYGRVPAGSVVVPGSLPSACGKYSLYAAVIVKKVDAQTRAKTAINELLRD